MRLQSLAPICLALVSTCLLCANTSLAQTPSGSSYPASPALEASPLDPARRDSLVALIKLPLRSQFKEREETRIKLCPDLIQKPDPAQTSVKAALMVVESSMNAEILFKKGAGPGEDTPAEKFSLFIEFTKSDILIRSSLPRFGTEAAGVAIPYPLDHTRGVFLEGKEGTSVLALIPSVSQCAVHSVVVCPRNYDKKGSLVPSKYEPVAARYFISTKADGLFAPPAGEKGKILASIRGTAGVPVPSPWNKESISANTPSVTLKNITPAESAHEFVPITLPSTATVETRLDFGTEASSLRNVWSHSNIEIAPFALGEWPPVRVQTVDLKVAPGQCFMISQWNETRY